MKEIDFMRTWLFELLKMVKDSRHEMKIVRNGHMSTHLFTPKDPLRELSTGHLLRIIINHAQLCEYTELNDEFMKDWIRLGRMIRDFADSPECDEFNQQFAKQPSSWT